MSDGSLPAKTVKNATFDLLRSFGIDTVFGNPGSTELPFLSDWPNDVRYVLGLQESSVIAMADGYAQATGNAAFVNLHAAAGVGHALGNIYTAFRNQTPMVITAGQQIRDLLPMHPYLFAEQATEFPKPYVKWSCEPARAEDVPAAIARAYHTAMQKPCGPTFVSIPIDDWNVPVEAPQIRTVSRDVAPDPGLLKQVAEALNRSERPVIVVGPQIDQENVWSETIALAEATGAAVWTAPFSSRASFPERHPLFQGFLPAAPRPVNDALKAYDTILVLGAPVFTFHVGGECELLQGGTPIFQITDDPTAAARSATGASIVGSLRLGLPTLLGMIEARKRTPPPLRAMPAVPEADTPIRAEYLLHALSEVLPERSIVVEEAPSHRPAMQGHLPFERPNSFYTMASGGLGFGLPAAVGFALADQTRRVVCVVGDGSAMYSFQSVWTAAQHGLPITIVLVNNGGYGAMRAFSEVLGVRSPPGIDLPGMDYVQLAAALGCPGRRISRGDDLKDALREACAARGPWLIEVEVDPKIAHLYDKQADA
ncbi:MAG TPA: benzoylformate decarboxylase [Caulobacteraceae bacterium]|jgi:benzoylformate decarboxylase|nr:benzoylformate decarboxylase [Caulobacteraceae bacterium]